MKRALLGLDEAREKVIGAAVRRPVEPVDLEFALGRTLAEDISSPAAVPGFDNSAMDGFAVRARDTAHASVDQPVALRLTGESRAGHPAERPLGRGESIQISTGARLPDGADAILRVEDAMLDGREVVCASPVAAGTYVRKTGDDIAAGETVLRAGARVGAIELGVLASLGEAAAPCFTRPSLSIVVTGDELLAPVDPMTDDGVRDTSSWVLPALADEAGAKVESVSRVSDDLAETQQAIARALASDVAVICGGVSVGEHDHVRPALSRLGVEESFWGVALRPGRPTWFGTIDGNLVFGLPGNPVSAIVTFLLFVRPALLAAVGRTPHEVRMKATLGEAYRKSPGRTHAVRVRLEVTETGWEAYPTRSEQASHILTSLLGADGLALIPAQRETVERGETVNVEPLPRL